MGFLPSAELAVGDSDVLFLESCVVRTGNSPETEWSKRADIEADRRVQLCESQVERDSW
jgi:hypothetical protein